MPGPLSTPRYWGEGKRNTTGKHGVKPDAPRQSGKTKYDIASGKAVRHEQNKEARREKNRR